MYQGESEDIIDVFRDRLVWVERYLVHWRKGTKGNLHSLGVWSKSQSVFALCPVAANAPMDPSVDPLPKGA